MTSTLASGTTATQPAASWPTRPQVGCAWSEVFDKLTILRLKQARLGDPAKRANVTRELMAVEAVVGDIARFPSALAGPARELAEVNALLWDIEDATRACECAQEFGDRFIELARSVYRENDRRARIKASIDRLLGSELVAEKSHLTAG